MKKLMKVAGVAVVFLTAQVVHAELELAPGTTITDYLPTITASTIAVGDDIYSYTGVLDQFEEKEEAKFELKETQEQDTGFGIITLEGLAFDPDPSVFANFLVYNNTPNTQVYQFNVLQPAYLNELSSLVYGSIVVSLQDTDDSIDGASLNDYGASIYEAYIDGNLVDTLLDPSFSLSTTPPANTVGSGLQEFGWNTYGAGVVNDIAIKIQFSLSAGDTATVLSRFDVVAIPEPASVGLLGFTTLGLFYRRRRKGRSILGETAFLRDPIEQTTAINMGYVNPIHRLLTSKELARAQWLNF
ncbi:MAG: hypothetical protein DRP64_03220 [Verrucomicrobia bacterium]|nr:MAG: hypothetical protein DRP64_03220 [Verrucomicrobiota bacterium]